MPTDQEYYEDETQWGNYQYVTLEQIINDLMTSIQHDEYISGIPRYQLILHAKWTLQHLNYDATKEIKAIELEISPTLFVTLPRDFVNYVRISWVDQNGRLHPMAENTNLSIANAYLQDNNHELLFDDQGFILTETGQRSRRRSETLVSSPGSLVSNTFFYPFFNQGFAPNADLSQVYLNGAYRLDKDNGVIEFSSDVFGKNVVLEYISDGLFTSESDDKIRGEQDIRVHKFAEDAVHNGIYWRAIRRRRNVPQSEKARAKDEWKTNLNVVMRRINTMRKDELLQYFRHSNQWVKGINISF